MNPFYRMSLDLGMKMGIPDRAAREATITLYLDKDAYRQALQIPSEDTIVVLLIDRMGTILWRTEGPFDDSQSADLRAASGRAHWIDIAPPLP